MREMVKERNSGYIESLHVKRVYTTERYQERVMLRHQEALLTRADSSDRNLPRVFVLDHLSFNPGSADPDNESRAD